MSTCSITYIFHLKFHAVLQIPDSHLQHTNNDMNSMRYQLFTPLSVYSAVCSYHQLAKQ